MTISTNQTQNTNGYQNYATMVLPKYELLTYIHDFLSNPRTLINYPPKDERSVLESSLFVNDYYTKSIAQQIYDGIYHLKFNENKFNYDQEMGRFTYEIEDNFNDNHGANSGEIYDTFTLYDENAWAALLGLTIGKTYQLLHTYDNDLRLQIITDKMAELRTCQLQNHSFDQKTNIQYVADMIKKQSNKDHFFKWLKEKYSKLPDQLINLHTWRTHEDKLYRASEFENQKTPTEYTTDVTSNNMLKQLAKEMIESESQNICGTTACIIGWYTTEPETNLRGLSYQTKAFCTGGVDAQMNYAMVSVADINLDHWQAIRLYFDITAAAADFLFSSDSYPRNIRNVHYGCGGGCNETYDPKNPKHGCHTNWISYHCKCDKYYDDDGRYMNEYAPTYQEVINRFKFIEMYPDVFNPNKDYVLNTQGLLSTFYLWEKQQAQLAQQQEPKQ